MSRIRRVNYRHLATDVLLITLSLYASLLLRVEGRDIVHFVPILTRYLALFVLLRIVVFIGFGVYDIIWRYISLEDATRLARAVVASSVGLVAISYFVPFGRLPRALFFIDATIVTILLAGIRIARRLLYEASSDKVLARTGRATLLVGASTNGRILEHRFRTDGQLGHRVIGFIDDDPQKIGRRIAGLKVLSDVGHLASVIEETEAKAVIVSIARPSGELLRRVVQASRLHGIKPRLMSTTPMGTSEKNIESVREIEFSDLLSRPTRSLDLSSVEALVRDRRVLVTGAGGTIGSELCRQILTFNPKHLLMLDHSEYNLYQIDQEISLRHENVVCVLTDIKDIHTLKATFSKYKPEVIFHSAAYKHVHLVEDNPNSSILNNVEGTLNTLKLSEEFEVGTFVLISTDKAVNPTGIMGATKRVCELLVAETGLRTGKNYTAVRFGNVLGSSGSLVPLLKTQIENREPVTITHPDMTRYFMLIPEAVSLVLQSATVTKPGDIALLKMGEPVKIVDLAKSLMALMGVGESDLPIVFTGLRPGEKLFEELYICGDELETSHPDILVLPAGDGLWNLKTASIDLRSSVDAILSLARTGNSEGISQMQTLIRAKSANPASFRPTASSSDQPVASEQLPPTLSN